MADDEGGTGGGSGGSPWPKEVIDIRDAVLTALNDAGLNSVPIQTMILDFAAPHEIDASEEMAGWLRSAAGIVAGHKESGLGKAGSKTDDHWTGDAAGNFSDFVSALMDATEQQKDILRELESVVSVYHETVAAVRGDLFDLVETYQKAFEEVDSSDIDKGLVIAGTVAGIAVSASPLGVVAAAIGGITAATTMAGESDEVTIAVSLGDALEKMRATVDERAKQIVTALKNIREYMKGEDIKKILNPSKPAIVSGAAFDPDEFMPKGVDGFESANDGVSTEPLVDQKGG